MRASPGGAGAAQSAAQRADVALRETYAGRGSPPATALDWDDYDALVAALATALGDRPATYSFTYEHPVRLQDPEAGVGKPYAVPLAFSDAGGGGEPLIAIGGLTNVAQRFDFLAMDAAPALRVIGLDLAGRGGSGWLAELADYHLETYVEQLAQLLDCLGLESCTLLGSSLGGSTAIRFAARHPERVHRLVLNDSSPYIPVERRARRARAVARHYVFRSPAELFRRTGAAEKHSGPAPDAVLLHSAHHRTRWSDEEGGRVYRHDLRALLAYRAEARCSLDMWSDWAAVQVPGPADSRRAKRCHVGGDHRPDARPGRALRDSCPRHRSHPDPQRRPADRRGGPLGLRRPAVRRGSNTTGRRLAEAGAVLQ